jgi:hypothetical protein
LQAAAERCRKEVLFWKDQLDHAVNEKKDLLERYTELYRHSYSLEHAYTTLASEHTELQHVLDRTVHLQDERRSFATPATPTSQASGASTPVSRQACSSGSCSSHEYEWLPRLSTPHSVQYRY